MDVKLVQFVNKSFMIVTSDSIKFFRFETQTLIIPVCEKRLDEQVSHAVWLPKFRRLIYVEGYANHRIISSILDNGIEQSISHVFNDEIHNIYANANVLIVVLDKKLAVFNPKTLQKIHNFNIELNPSRLAAVSMNDDSPYCCYSCSGNNDSGKFGVINWRDQTLRGPYLVHHTPIVTMAMSPTHEYVATGSQQGTHIRITSFNGDPIREFYRGMPRMITLHSLMFNATGEYLTSTSSTETIHVFAVNPEKYEQELGMFEYLRSLFTRTRNYVRSSEENGNRDRSFGYVHLSDKNQDIKDIANVIVDENKKSAQLVVLSSNGIVDFYHLNLQYGGEATFQINHNLKRIQFPRTSLRSSLNLGSFISTNNRVSLRSSNEGSPHSVSAPIDIPNRGQQHHQAQHHQTPRSPPRDRAAAVQRKLAAMCKSTWCNLPKESSELSDSSDSSEEKCSTLQEEGEVDIEEKIAEEYVSFRSSNEGSLHSVSAPIDIPNRGQQHHQAQHHQTPRSPPRDRAAAVQRKLAAMSTWCNLPKESSELSDSSESSEGKCSTLQEEEEGEVDIEEKIAEEYVNVSI